MKQLFEKGIEETMETLDRNMDYVRKHINYMAENPWIIPIIIEQVALRNDSEPIKYMEEMLEMMKIVQQEEGPAELDF